MRKPTIVFGMNSMFAVQHLLREILGWVGENGFEVAVIAPRGKLPKPDSAFAFHPVSMEREIAPVADLRSLWQIWRILRSIRPSVSNMSTPKMGFIGGAAAWLARVPHRIYTLRGLRYETTRGWKRALLIACERAACACAHQVICISRSVRETAIRNQLAAPEKLRVLGERVSEGIPLKVRVNDLRPAPDELRAQAGIPPGASVIGFVGRLTRDKGIHELIECFRALRRENHSAHLLLLGDFETGDPVDEATSSFIRSNPAVHWLGYIAQPRPYYDLMDVFVFPTHREGLGKVLLEAAAAGKSVVSTYTTGVVDVVQDGVTGILVPPGNATALTRATATLLGNRELASQMGQRARLLVEQHFDNSIYLERLGKMLNSLANNACTWLPDAEPVIPSATAARQGS
jgi:glycosyltransferase involved in cell wall biosynthesis